LTQDEISQLRDRILFGNLSDEERRELFRAALKDQSVFDALADDDELRELLADERTRGEFQRGLGDLAPEPLAAEPSPGTAAAGTRRRRNFPSRPVLAAVGLAASAVIAAGILVLNQRSSVQTPIPSQDDTRRPPPVQTPLPEVGVRPEVAPTASVIAPEAPQRHVRRDVPGAPASNASPSSSIPPAGPPPASAPAPTPVPAGGKTRGGLPAAPGQDNVSEDLRDAYFDFGSDALHDDEIAALARGAKYLVDHPAVRVRIEGYADPVEAAGREEALELGERRARVLKDFLVSHGVEATRIETMSLGSEKPAERPASTVNRRAHFVVIGY
jgi:peptidoglycan-associated lipoprotein